MTMATLNLGKFYNFQKFCNFRNETYRENIHYQNNKDLEYTSLHPLQLFRSLTLGSYCGFLFVCSCLNVETEKKSIPNVFYFPTFLSDNRILTDSWLMDHEISPEPSPDRKTRFIDFNIADKWNRISELQIKSSNFGYPRNKIIKANLTHGHPVLPTNSDRKKAIECSNLGSVPRICVSTRVRTNVTATFVFKILQPLQKSVRILQPLW